MAFVTRTWKDRISEYPNRRTINDGTITKQVTVARDEGVITEAGDSFSATNMNDLEERIYQAVRGGAWTEVTGTLTAGSTSLTLSNAGISSSSTIDYYTNYYGVNPTGVSVSSGSVTLTFEAQDVDIGVKVRVS